MSYLLDSGYLFALLNDREKRHQDVLKSSRLITGKIILPSVVSTEVAYLIQRDIGAQALAEFIELLSEETFLIADPIARDYQRAAQVVRQYQDSHIDFVDAIIVAMAERMNITQILTPDTRHFRLFRPLHCVAFELIP